MFGRTRRTMLHAFQIRQMYPPHRRPVQQEPLLLLFHRKGMGRQVRALSETRYRRIRRTLPQGSRVPGTHRHQRVHRFPRDVPEWPVQEYHRQLQLQV